MHSPLRHGHPWGLVCLLFLGWCLPSHAAPQAGEMQAAAPELRHVVFAVRKQGRDGHWYANFGYYGPDETRTAYLPGGRLCLLDLERGTVETLIDDPQGGIRDPVLSHDAQRIVFSWRKDEGRHYHLWECRIDGTNLRQLTDGEWDDIEPCILPDDSIVFVSSRCKRWVNCWLTQVATLHRCDVDGGNMVRISDNIEHDNTPWPLPDGRILYQRWEYIDRSQISYHHLWTTNPDGTNQINYYGNEKPGIVMIDAKPIPGNRGEVVAIFSPGHGKAEHAGRVAVVTPQRGPDDPAGARVLTKDADFRDPWALGANCFLVARHGELLQMNGKGESRVLHRLEQADRDAGFQLHEPRPVITRPREAIIPSRVDRSQASGRLVLANILEGRNMEGVKPGEIRKLLVLEPLPKPINYTGGMDPLSYGGSFTLERVVGTVPVEEDGSAYIELPAHRNFFFVALDEHDMAVKRMQSFVSVQPGQMLSCVGCHEQRTRTTNVAGYLQATSRAPSVPTPIEGVPQVFDYPRDIQPILDRHCISCHGYEKGPEGGPMAGGLILTGDRGPMFSHSYYMMTVSRLFSDGRNRARSNYAPRTLGSSASRILGMIDGSHYEARLSATEARTLRLWIDAAATYPGTYAALGTGMIGGYEENKQVHHDRDWPTTRAGAEVIGRRCASCHGADEALPPLPLSMSDERDMSFWMPRVPHRSHHTSRHLIFNLSRPEKSLLLLAPLRADAGGFGHCGESVFRDRKDPDYRTLVRMVEAGRDDLQRRTRFDMPGFQPHPAYIREMKRYGILPGNFSPEEMVDPYATDESYWRSLWHQPDESATGPEISPVGSPSP